MRWREERVQWVKIVKGMDGEGVYDSRESNV